MLDFPSAPAIGDTFTSGGRTYTWTGNRWAMQYASADPAALLPHLPSGRRNLIINGGFIVWQRGISFSVGGYTADRWFCSGTTGYVGTERTDFGMRVSRHTTDGFMRVAQGIEWAQWMFGSTMTLSFKATASCQVSVVISTTDGSIDTAGDQIISEPVVTDGSRQTVTFSIPAEAAYVPTMLRVRFTADDAVVGDTIDFSEVQLEVGSVATPFDRRSFGDELAFCQRYFYKTTSGIWGPTYLSDRAIGNIWFPVPMRAVPTAVFSTDRTTGSSFANQITTQYHMQAQFTGTTWVAIAAGATFDAEL